MGHRRREGGCYALYAAQFCGRGLGVGRDAGAVGRCRPALSAASTPEFVSLCRCVVASSRRRVIASAKATTDADDWERAASAQRNTVHTRERACLSAARASLGHRRRGSREKGGRLHGDARECHVMPDMNGEVFVHASSRTRFA